MRRIGVIVLVFALGGATPAGGVSPPPLLALTDGELGFPSRLVALDPRTLEVRAQGPKLPGFAFGFEYARSPTGRQIAFLPRPSDSANRLFLIDVRSLRVSARIDLGRPACSAAWPTRRRLVLVVAAPPCYAGEHPLEELVVDPVEQLVVTRRPISDAASIVREASAEDGLALLLAPRVGSGGVRLVLVGVDGVRTIALPEVRAGGRAALALDPAGRRAFVAEPGWVVTEVDLASGALRRHVLGHRRRLAVAEKGIVGAVVDAIWVGGGGLALAGGVVRRDGSFAPEGARLVDTRTWKARTLDPGAGSVAAGDGSIVAFQGPYDERANQARGTGAAVYTRTGRPRYRVLATTRVTHVRIAAGYGYALEGTGVGDAFDLRTGRRTAAAIDGSLVWTLLVGDRGP